MGGLDPLEIFMADDKDLNQWAPLGKVVSIRSKDLDEKEREYFNRQKKVNVNRVKRVLKSLYTDEKPVSSAEEKEAEVELKKDKKIKKKKKKRSKVEAEDNNDENESGSDAENDKPERKRGKK